jgi:class 3 adenylate cyclase/tetratricopeptide (TPR) repeat protein
MRSLGNERSSGRLIGLTARSLPRDSVQQRRHITILFSDLSESTRISKVMEPELYADLLQRLRDIYEQLVPRHGGEIVRIDGDGVLCIFGYPEPHEDSGRRAVEAAIDLHSAVGSLKLGQTGLGYPIQLHSGIHAGIVLVRSGDLVRGKFEILGDATNIAAHLCESARAGQILVSEATLGGDIALFQAGAREWLDVRSGDKPLAVFAVRDRVPHATRFAARTAQGLTLLSGRDQDLAQLHRALDRASSGTAHVVIVAGGAGIGKTRLVSEFLDGVGRAGRHAFRGYCEAYQGARPIQAFGQLADAMLAAGAVIEDDHQGLLEALRRGVINDSAFLTVDRIASLFAALIRSLWEDQPVILCIDDWQWADDASRQLLDRLETAITSPTLIIIATRSATGLSEARGRRQIIYLLPLAAEEADAAIASLLPMLGPGTIKSIRVQSGGNPLFLEELCHAHDRGEDVVASGDRNARLNALIQARFALLSPLLADIVRKAAIIGHIIPAWLFEAISGLAPDSPELAVLGAEDFLFGGEVPGTLRFKHGITCDAIYQMIGLHERTALHASVAQALHKNAEQNGEETWLEALAYHHTAAGHTELAIDYAERAGDKALAASALDKAQTHYRSALELLQSPLATIDADRRSALLARKFGQSCVIDPSREQIPVLEAACRRAGATGDREAIAWTEYWLGNVLYGLGEPRLSIRHLRRAEAEALLAGDTKLLVTIRAALGQAFATAGDYPTALTLLEEAITIKRCYRKPGRPSIVLSYALSCRGMVHADQGRFEAAFRDFDEAIDVLAGAEHGVTASVLTQRCAADIWRGQYAEARALALQSRGIAERARARYIFVNCRSLVAYPSWHMSGDPALADEIAGATLWLEQSARHQFTSLNFGWLTQIMVGLGRYSDARRYAARAFQRARKGDRLGEAMAARAMAVAAAQRHGWRSPSHYMRLARASAERRGAMHEAAQNRLCEAEIALLEGKVMQARWLCKEAEDQFLQLNMDYFATRASRLADQLVGVT